LDSLQNVCKIKTPIAGSLLIRTPEKQKSDATEIEFKTPKAPGPSLFPSTPVSIFPKSHLHHSIAQEASSSSKIHKPSLSCNETLVAEIKPVLIQSFIHQKKNHHWKKINAILDMFSSSSSNPFAYPLHIESERKSQLDYIYSFHLSQFL
jgi:hypothetical protein